MKNIYLYETKIGKIAIAEDSSAITDLYFYDGTLINDVQLKETELLRKASEQLIDYFEGKRKSFELPLSPRGTDFQQSVWKALLEIPFGETRSYGDIAKRIGNPKASRAVGMANNKNPIAIFIPCHRVIGANGSLVGYGGGLDIKKYLLSIENVPIFNR